MSLYVSPFVFDVVVVCVVCMYLLCVVLVLYKWECSAVVLSRVVLCLFSMFLVSCVVYSSYIVVRVDCLVFIVYIIRSYSPLMC